MADLEKVFTDIYNDNKWGYEDKSGNGSSVKQTEKIRKEIPELFKKYKIKSMIDIPCGSFTWMKLIIEQLDLYFYFGCDIVSELISNNLKLYKRANTYFEKKDLLVGDIPENADLILVRDCLVHFSYKNILKALRNIKNTNIKYLLTTSFTGREENFDIQDGNWRPLNLTKAPFNLNNPLEIINEDCTENFGMYSDKSLLLYKISDLQL